MEILDTHPVVFSVTGVSGTLQVDVLATSVRGFSTGVEVFLAIK